EVREAQGRSDLGGGPQEAAGVGPDGAAGVDGTYHLRAGLADRAGNPGVERSTFEVDTVAPTFEVESPARDAFLSTVKPFLVVRYADDRSGVDPDRLVVEVGGRDLARQLSRDSTRAEGGPSAAGRERAHGGLRSDRGRGPGEPAPRRWPALSRGGRPRSGRKPSDGHLWFHGRHATAHRDQRIAG